jgi:hypothetical protein
VSQNGTMVWRHFVSKARSNYAISQNRGLRQPLTLSNVDLSLFYSGNSCLAEVTTMADLARVRANAVRFACKEVACGEFSFSRCSCCCFFLLFP